MRNHVRRLREQIELSQEDLADSVGVSRQTIGSIERGRHDPSATLAIKIARQLGTTVEEVFLLESEPSPEPSSAGV